MRKMRNWLAVHAHFRGGSGVHNKVAPRAIRSWRFWEEYDDENPTLFPVSGSDESEDSENDETQENSTN